MPFTSILKFLLLTMLTTSFYSQKISLTQLIPENCEITEQVMSKSNNLYTCTKCNKDYILVAQLNTCAPVKDSVTEQKLNDSLKQTNTQAQQKIPNQDPNCKIPSYVKCTECYPFYYWNKQVKKCVPANPYCKTIDENGACTSCFQGYQIVDNITCLRQSIFNSRIPSDPFCLQNKNGSCSECSFRYFKSNKTGLCVQVSPQCKTWNITNGNCLTCYKGYIIKDNQCQIFKRLNEDPLCAQVDKDQICIKCVFRSYLMNSICKTVSDFCRTWNQTNGSCISCYDGYYVQNNDCILAPIYQTYDAYCAETSNKQCIKCYSGYYLKDKSCLLGNPLCKTISNDGKCSSCYNGFILMDGDCNIRP